MCLTDLYVKLLKLNIAHVTYDAEIAGLRFACFQILCLLTCLTVMCELNDNQFNQLLDSGLPASRLCAC